MDANKLNICLFFKTNLNFVAEPNQIELIKHSTKEAIEIWKTEQEKTKKVKMLCAGQLELTFLTLSEILIHSFFLMIF